ncbi:MAG: peptidoglycan-binding domain-containing protein [Pseudonocardiaceae bacterium]
MRSTPYRILLAYHRLGSSTSPLRPPSVATAARSSGSPRVHGLDQNTVGRRRRVSQLQQLLTEHGSATKVDGMFGPRTQEALNAFQESVLLAPSEVVDAVTADVLEGRQSPPEPICDEDVPITT